ncbi:uncharacterized protein LOC130744870 [Lotus japonicus]|uniref:uncharacterized protein LOC130744870 n=1 Tax=Lotus japonicus TaxID=34305 RepID=UPI0025827AD9|nr:uncharacterized protein LOC130744870 [Lotus japonicus]
MNTLRADRGRFARICVELDLTEAVVGKVCIEGFWYKIEYEGLHVICTKCGCYGNRSRECKIPAQVTTTVVRQTKSPPDGTQPEAAAKETEPQKPRTEEPETEVTDLVEDNMEEAEILVQKDPETAGEKKEETEEIELEVIGEWMTVTKKKKKTPKSMPKVGENPKIKKGGNHGSNHGSNNGQSFSKKGHHKQWAPALAKKKWPHLTLLALPAVVPWLMTYR